MDFSKTTRRTTQQRTPRNTSNRTNRTTTTTVTPTTVDTSFKINRESMNGALSDVVPEVAKGWFAEIGEALGVDLLNIESLTPEQLDTARDKMQKVNESLLCMKELQPIVLEYLQSRIDIAKFQAKVVKEASKAQIAINRAQARAYTDIYKYLKKATNLENRVNAQRNAIDAAYDAFGQLQDVRSNLTQQGIQNQLKLGEATAQQFATMKSQRDEVAESRKIQMEQFKTRLQTGSAPKMKSAAPVD